MNQTPEQARAIAARDRDVFLEAGAGTGKTAVLVGRYCDAVTEDGVPTEEILAFTFTERAAGELRTRIRLELLRRSALAGEGGEGERAAELALRARDSERAWISTIHAFCKRLLSTMPLAAGLDPRFRVLDAAEAGRLAERAFEDALEQLTLEREAAALLAAGLQVPRLRRLVLSAHEALRSQAIARPQLPPVLERPSAAEEDAESAIGAREYEAVRDLFASFSDRYEALKLERSGLDFEDLQLGALALLRSNETATALWRGRFRHILVDEFQDTNRLQVELLEVLSGPETRVFAVGDELQSIYGFRHADLEAFRAERRRAELAPDAERELMQLSGNFRAHPDLVAAVNAIGERLIGADYASLTVGTVAPAEPPETDTEALGPRVELLLTETPGWAEEEIELPSASESGPASVAEARALAERLAELVAGGVKRSEIVVLLRAYTHAAAFEEALRLAGLEPHVIGGRGYWSHQQVEDLICLLSVIANPLDDEPLLGALASPSCGLSADALWLLRRAAGSRRHLWPVIGPEQSEEQNEPEGSPEPSTPSKPQASELPAQGSLLDLLEEADDESDAEVEEEDEHAKRARHYLGVLPEIDRQRLERFHARVVDLRELAPLLALDELCDRAAREFGYDLATLVRSGGAARIANVRKLMRLASEYEQREGRDLRGFLDYAVSRAASADAEGQAATEAEGVEGVRILTVHAAKGLEFPVVAVADLGRSLLAGGSQPDVRVGRVGGTRNGDSADAAEAEEADAEPRMGLRLVVPGAEPVSLGELSELAEEEAATAAEEALRLAHVAITRPQQRLILSGTFSERHLSRREDQPHSASVLARLLPELGVEGGDDQRIAIAAPAAREGLDASYRAPEIRVRVNSPSAERAAALRLRRAAGDERSAEPAATSVPPLAELQEALLEQPLRPLSYSAISNYSRCGYRFYVERVLGLAPVEPGRPSGAAASPRERRRRFGNAVHALLEWSARNRWAPPGPDRVAAALAGEGLDPDSSEAGRATAMIQRWLDSDLRRSLEQPLVRLHPEAAFLLNLGGTVIRGQMDLLAEIPGEGQLVVDYKTDLLGTADPEQRMRRYDQQRDLYALAAHAGAGDRPGEIVAGVRTAYAFLDSPGDPLELAYDTGSLADARTRLEVLIAGIRSGRFEVTDAPHRGLCGDCPARERLCSHPPELTLAEGVAAL